MLRALGRPPIGAAAATAAAARVPTTYTVRSARFATHPNREKANCHMLDFCQGGGRREEASAADAKRAFDAQLRCWTTVATGASKRIKKQSTNIFIRNAVPQLKSQSTVAHIAPSGTRVDTGPE